MMACAFLVCMAHLAALAKKDGRPSSLVSDLGLWIMIGAILGARTSYVIANWSDFAASPGLIFRVDQGGLIYYGGLFGATLATIIFARVRREPLWSLWDFIATALPLGHAIGRIGCFLNGCCYGSVCDLPWSIYAEGARRHPVQLYEAFGNLAIYALINWLYRRRQRDGRLAALYLILYPLLRFIAEWVRGDVRQHWLGLTMAQDISLGIMAIGFLLWFLLPRPDAPSSSIQR
jgi:phosphatidylglycerol:prolipoprotein diacylglycerol transferase